MLSSEKIFILGVDRPSKLGHNTINERTNGCKLMKMGFTEQKVTMRLDCPRDLCAATRFYFATAIPTVGFRQARQIKNGKPTKFDLALRLSPLCARQFA